MSGSAEGGEDGLVLDHVLEILGVLAVFHQEDTGLAACSALSDKLVDELEHWLGSARALVFGYFGSVKEELERGVAGHAESVAAGARAVNGSNVN